MTKERLEFISQMSVNCEHFTIQGEEGKELIRLAKLGLALENKMRSELALSMKVMASKE